MRPVIAFALALLSASGASGFRSRSSNGAGAPADSTIVSFETREGTRLAVDVSRHDGSIAFDLLGQLWVVSANGGEARALTDAVRDTSEDLDPSFSPDGRRLLFQSDRPGGRALWLMDVEDGTPTRVTAGHIPYHARAEAAWAPDGRRFVYVRGGALVIHSLDASDDRIVRVDGLPNVAASSPSWSADGATIAFVNGGRRPSVWRVGAAGGKAESIGDSTVAPVVATLSPSGNALALIAPDSLGRPQLWVQPLGGRARRLTAHQDLVRLRARWSADARFILYSADGRLWRVPADGGTAVEIPFVARIRFVRRTARVRDVTFPAPGSAQSARGFDGLAISPDASLIAMLALDSLWVWKPGATPRAVRAVGRGAHELAWSPDARSVVWSAGVAGEENLFITDVASANTRALTAMPGGESNPAWSPDGRHIAFMHAPVTGEPSRLRIVAATGQPPLTSGSSDSAGTRSKDLGPIDGLWMSEQGYVWTPDSRAIVTYANPLLSDEPFPARFRLIPLDGARRALAARLTAPSLGAWFDSVFTYVERDRLWRVGMTPDSGVVGSPQPLGDDAALAASTARDGSVLYLAEDGLRLRRPGGSTMRLGWPLAFHAAAPPRPLLVRNVHVIDGTGAGASPLRDVLLRNGRIGRIAPAGTIATPNAATVVDAGGRVAMPGLIDMHAHFFPETPPTGFLYHGVTTARDVGSPAARTAALRDAIDAGTASGPRIVLGGFMFHSQAESDNGPTGMMDQQVADSAGLERAMRLAGALGAGYIKHRTFEDWGAGTRTIAAAHRHGLPISGHCAHILPLIAAGMDGKEHSGDCFRDFGRIYSDFTRLYATAGIWVDPTVGLYAPIARAAADSTVLDQPAIAPWLVATLRKRYLGGQRTSLERWLVLARARTAALQAAGVPLIAGTDQGLADGIHWELEELVRSGLSPSEAIVAVTSRAANVLGAGGEIGTVAVGKRADLVILDADPLIDITNTRRIWRVIQGGRIVDREALLRDAPNGSTRSLTTATRTRSAPRPQ
jgi:Tol biopolymer transport system component/cytosine/adenosine deaminase-related metal-dependent hydrolase